MFVLEEKKEIESTNNCINSIWIFALKPVSQEEETTSTVEKKKLTRSKIAYITTRVSS